MRQKYIRIKNWWQSHPKLRLHFWRIFRFGIVGALSTALHYGIYCLLLLVAGANIAYTAGYAVALVCNYILTTRFTFRRQPTKGNAAGFATSHALNYVIEIGLLNLFLWLGISKWLAPILVIVIAVPLNFVMLSLVFAPAPKKSKSTQRRSVPPAQKSYKSKQIEQY